MSEYSLSESDFVEGGEAYIRFCSGLAVVQYPHDMVGVHNRPEVEESADEIIGIARDIMFKASRRIIRVSHSPEVRSNLQQLSSKFIQAEALMREIVNRSCEENKTRISRLNDTYAVLRPAPFLDQTLYRNLAHGNYKYIKTVDLLDGYIPATELMEPINSSDAELGRGVEYEPELIIPRHGGNN